jgi:hypothetical protein
MAMLVCVWRHMPQIILQFPYGGMDLRHDPAMELPPREVWDQRGMLVYLCFVILIM